MSEIDHGKGKIYLGSCPESFEVKQEIKDYLDNKGYLIIDLGGFAIDDPVACGVIGREVAEKVIENTIFEKDSDHHGERVYGLLFSPEGKDLEESIHIVEQAKAAVVEPQTDLAQLKVLGNHIFCFATNRLSIHNVKEALDALLN
jgi:hypothetical protein